MTVYTSNNCGETWQNRLVKSGEDLATTGPLETEFTPSSTDQWAEFSFIIPAGLVTTMDNMRLKFSFYSNGGNNIYIDDINITSLSGSDINSQTLAGNEIKLYPNPANSDTKLYLELNNSSNVSIQIIDLNGRLVNDVFNNKMSVGSYNIDINNLDNLATGVYYVKVRLDNNETFLPLVKQ